MSQPPQPVVLGYWRLRGLGHPVRLLLKYLEVNFEDKYYTDQSTRVDWHGDRAKLDLDFPNLPYLIDGSTKLTESRAIMKYLCRTRKPELLGKTADVQTKLDMVDNFFYDFWYTQFAPLLYEYTDELHKQFKEVEPVKLGYLSKFLGENKWITGNDMTYIDFVIYEVFHHLQVYDKDCLEKFSNLKKFMTRFENIPSIKAYMESPAFLKTPLYGEASLAKMQ